MYEHVEVFVTITLCYKLRQGRRHGFESGGQKFEAPSIETPKASRGEGSGEGALPPTQAPTNFGALRRKSVQ